MIDAGLWIAALEMIFAAAGFLLAAAEYSNWPLGAPLDAGGEPWLISRRSEPVAGLRCRRRSRTPRE
jgi:hypothetical protein